MITAWTKIATTSFKHDLLSNANEIFGYSPVVYKIQGTGVFVAQDWLCDWMLWTDSSEYQSQGGPLGIHFTKRLHLHHELYGLLPNRLAYYAH
jgi:hypothetical protein